MTGMSARVLLPPLRARLSLDVKADGYGGRWRNESTGHGGALDRHASTTFDPAVSLDEGTVDALMMFSGLARKIVWRKVEDALRPGFTLTSEVFADNPALERACAKWLRRRGVIAAIKQAKASARATGGGMIFAATASGRFADPLDKTGERVINLVVRDRFEVQPHGRVNLDPDSPWYGTTERWRVRGQTRDHLVHASRLVRLDGEPISDRARAYRDGWGASVLDLVFAELRNQGLVSDSAAEAVTLLTQGVFKMKGYHEALASSDASKIAARYRAIRAGLGTLGDIVLDESESYDLKSRSFAGLADIREIVEAALLLACDYPRLILLGETTPGLSGNASGEIRAYYDAVASEREDAYEPALLELCSLLLADPRSPLGGIVPADLGVEWPSVWAPSPGEKADLDLKAAQRRKLDAELLSAAELRTDLQLAEVYDLDELAAGPATTGEPVVDAGPTPEPELPVDGEQLVELSRAARALGYRSSAPLARLVRGGQIRHWRAGAGRVRVLWSEVLATVQGRPVH
jgi:phage-related protein (TIGR01555 family)